MLLNDCIPVERRDKFVNDLFWNLPEIRENNSLLLADLLQRQLEHKVVHKIGNIFLKHVSDLFEHFIAYGSHQIISKHILETERSSNTAFAEFVQVREIAVSKLKFRILKFRTVR